MKDINQPKGKIYCALKDLEVMASACQIGVKSFDFGPDSLVCRHLVQRTFSALEEDDQRQNIRRIEPFTILLKYKNSPLWVSLLNRKMVDRLISGEPIGQVLRDQRETVFKELLYREPTVTMDELRRMLAPSELLAPGGRKESTKRIQVNFENYRTDLAKLRDTLNISDKLLPVSGELVSPAASVLASVSPAIEAEGKSPEMAKAFISSMQSVREQFCLRQQDLAEGKLCAIALDIRDRRMHLKMRYRYHLPVILTLYTPPEVAILEKVGPWDHQAIDELLSRRIARLFTEAYCQGGLISTALVAILTHQSLSRVTRLVNQFEASHSLILPTPGTIHDAGSKITHKVAIVKMHLSGKTCRDIARETFHSEEAVSRYIDDFERTLIACAHQVPQSLLPRLLSLSLHVVKQYQAIIDEEIGGLAQLKNLLTNRGIEIREYGT